MQERAGSMVVQALKAKLELSWIVAASLMEELESPFPTVLEKRALFRFWHEVTRDGDTLVFLWELFRQHERTAIATGVHQAVVDTIREFNPLPAR